MIAHSSEIHGSVTDGLIQLESSPTFGVPTKSLAIHQRKVSFLHA